MGRPRATIPDRQDSLTNILSSKAKRKRWSGPELTSDIIVASAAVFKIYSEVRTASIAEGGPSFRKAGWYVVKASLARRPAYIVESLGFREGIHLLRRGFI